MLIFVLSLLILTSAVIHIRAEYCGPRYQVYLFKPLTTTLILTIAWGAVHPVVPLYKYAIVLGLVFSLAGDVFLMLPRDRFLAGLGSFFMAHLCYIVAFYSGMDLPGSILLILPFALYGVAVLWGLWPFLGKLKVPVLGYVLVILIMAWQALERLANTGEPGALLAFFGAVLFVISDTALGVDRFRRRFRSAHAVILVTYYLAQWSIAFSVGLGTDSVIGQLM